jgi:hypothetical protein
MLLRRDQPGDAEKARSLLESARTAYRELGMSAFASTASTVLASTSPQPRGPLYIPIA